MALTATVVIPWAPGCPHREAALTWVLSRWAAEQPSWPVLVAEAPEGPWVKADAVAAVLGDVATDLLVLSDADVWCDATPDAAARVDAGAPWAIPHRRVLRLSQAATADLLAGQPQSRPQLDERPYIGVAGGGLVVLRTADYHRVPLDRRFAGWGGEDDAWGVALDTLLGGPWRGHTSLTHLWHPPQPRLDRKVGNAESDALRRRYWAANHRPDAMRALLEEATCPRSASR